MALLGIGNPLLDIMATVDQEFLDKYNLQPSAAILAEEKHMSIYGEMVAKDPTYVAGGSTANSIRFASWMLQDTPASVSFMGSVGDDESAAKLRAANAAVGIETHYMTDAAAATGRCAVCVLDKERTMVTDLAAANSFKMAHLDTERAGELVDAASVVYMAGFFLTVSAESAMRIAGDASNVFMANLSAEFLVQVPPLLESVKAIVPHVDVLFANEHEAAAWAAAQGWGGDSLEEVARKTAALPKTGGRKERIVVFTQGAESTIVAVGGAVSVHAVPKVEADEIVDVNGAGDAFVGGFVAKWVATAGEPDLAACVETGHYAAGECIRRKGATVPEKVDEKFAL